MNRMTKLSPTANAVAFSIALALLAGCTVGPDYKAPDVNLPQNWISTQHMAANNAIEQAWWENFHDPVLNQLILKASDGNLDLKIAEARINEARATRATASSALLPQGDLTAGGNRQANRVTFPGGNSSGLSTLLHKPYNTYQTGFDASWELDLFGGHRRDVESADATLAASEASYDDVMISLRAEVARTYLDIRQNQAQLAVTEDLIAANRNTLDIAHQRFKAGDAAHIDVTQAQAQLEQGQTQLPYYRNLLAQAQLSLDVLLGENPGTAKAIIGAPAAIPAADKLLILGTPAATIADRPDIRVAERKLAAATAQQGIAVAQFFPDISLTGFIGLLNTDAGSLLKTSSQSWMAGANVMWPILSYGKLQANLDAANAQQQEAMANYQKTILGALSDVERSVTAYTEQEEYRQSLIKVVDDNRRANKVAMERYKEGLTSFLDVLDARRTLYTSLNQLVEADAKTSEDLVALYKSLGGGWKLNPG